MEVDLSNAEDPQLTPSPPRRDLVRPLHGLEELNEAVRYLFLGLSQKPTCALLGLGCLKNVPGRISKLVISPSVSHIVDLFPRNGVKGAVQPADRLREQG